MRNCIRHRTSQARSRALQRARLCYRRRAHAAAGRRVDWAPRAW